jgi:hypothetical protein
MENLQRFEQPPTAVNVTVAKRRPREYLTEREIERENKCNMAGALHHGVTLFVKPEVFAREGAILAL